MLSRKPFHGRVRGLVVAFDVGTTYSGVSYAILDPGEVPKIQGVTRYPAQEHVGGDCKIPSIVYYDQHGTPRALGAEALQDHIIEQAEDEQWVKLEWWKLHLRAKHLAASHIADDDLPPVPFGKSAVDVLADFMRYLFYCTQKYIEDSHGVNLWRSVENRIEYVLTHPNGWEGPQQKQIRRAAIMAGLVPSSPEGQDRVHLLTEGEASLHFCVSNILASEALSRMPILSPEHARQEEEQPRERGVVIIDAGGGTIDLSAYSMKLSPASFEETAPAECRLQGSVLVTRRASALLKRKLDGSKYCNPEILRQMTDIFDKTTKLRLRNAEDPQYIKFGTVRDKDPQYDIRSGQLRLSGKIVADLFEPAIREIMDAFRKQQQASPIPITSVFLVGGFAASEWLFSSLRRYFDALNINLCRPDSHVNKAVADGAVSYRIDHLVSSRVAKLTYGTECSLPYNPSDIEHRARQKSIYRGPSAQLALPNAFASIVTRGTRVAEKQEFQESFAVRRSSQVGCNSLDIAITSYRGPLEQPTWMDNERDQFSTLCTVRADITKLAKSLSPKRSVEGSLYFALEIKIILLFGLTELTAQVSWMENGVEVR
ncbi:hypothetical protein L210DRAFT_3611856 [Boletus edulis BED1]|uniref:Uncharacterized protein n=1 Tax=Boletus edulis BED1 TaxID=1328754 RepID=A0AAD4GF10_BOLED|nr:hypothetical protein L210DRAFT_3611856 [Boletus edulis BED1]